MTRRVILLVLALLASLALVPMVASAHETCVEDPVGDAPTDYDIRAACASAGDDDPVELSVATAGAAADTSVTFAAAGWSVSRSLDQAAQVTVVVDDEVVQCAGATAYTSDTGFFGAYVPAACLPTGEVVLTVTTTDAEGATLDEVGGLASGVPAATEQEDPADDPTEAVPDDAPTVDPGPAPFTRLSGATRIETAVVISTSSWPEGAPAVLLANADNPVDALPGSRVDVEGPILYVPACAPVPQVVLDEIARLAPEEVVLLGGPGAICDQVGYDAVAAAGITPDDGDGHDDVVPADEQEGDVRSGEFGLLATRPATGHEDATGEAFIARNETGTTVTIRVTGLLPETDYASHLHDGACATGGGDHFKFDPDGGDLPPNEIHLDFTTDAEGEAAVTATNALVAGEDGRSVVVHTTGEGATRVMCADLVAG